MPQYIPNTSDFISPLPKTLTRYRGRLFSYNDERSSDNPIFIGYRPGWKSHTDPYGPPLHADAEPCLVDILERLEKIQLGDCK